MVAEEASPKNSPISLVKTDQNTSICPKKTRALEIITRTYERATRSARQL